jgi:hypothetical protein
MRLTRRHPAAVVVAAATRAAARVAVARAAARVWRSPPPPSSAGGVGRLAARAAPRPAKRHKTNDIRQMQKAPFGVPFLLSEMKTQAQTVAAISAQTGKWSEATRAGLPR